MENADRISSDCVPLVNVIGLFFQIRDDYMNLSSTQYTENKGLCEDLTEGKFSFPVIHSIRSNPQNLQLINILKQKTTDDVVKRYAISYMESTGSFEYCRRRLRSLQEKALHLTDVVDEGTGRGAGLRRILDNMAVVWSRDSTGNLFRDIFEQIWLQRKNRFCDTGNLEWESLICKCGSWETRVQLEIYLQSYIMWDTLTISLSHVSHTNPINDPV